MNPTTPIVPTVQPTSASRSSGWGAAAILAAAIFALAALAGGALLLAVVLFLGVRVDATSAVPPSGPAVQAPSGR